MCVCDCWLPSPQLCINSKVPLIQDLVTGQEVKNFIFYLQVLSCVLDPLLQMCTVSASNLGTADMATFMVNSLYMMKTTLALFEFTDRRLEMLQFQVNVCHKRSIHSGEIFLPLCNSFTILALANFTDLVPVNPLT